MDINLYINIYMYMNLEEELNKHDKKCYKELVKNELYPEFKIYNKQFKFIKEELNKKIERIVKHITELKRNKIVILSGYPGSGKSTITKGLKDNNYKVLSLDDKIKDYKDMVDKTRYYMKRGMTKNIVLDGTFLKQEQIDMFEWVKGEKGHDLIIIHIDIPMIYAYFNNIKRCLDKRNKRTYVPYGVYISMEKSKTLIVPDKNSYIITYK